MYWIKNGLFSLVVFSCFALMPFALSADHGHSGGGGGGMHMHSGGMMHGGHDFDRGHHRDWDRYGYGYYPYYYGDGGSYYYYSPYYYDYPYYPYYGDGSGLYFNFGY